MPARRSSRRWTRKTSANSQRPSIGLTLASAFAGGVIGHKLGDGDTFTSIAAAAISAYVVRKADHQKHRRDL